MHQDQFATNLRARLSTNWECVAPVGHPSWTIEEFESLNQLELPKIYKSFLEVCGLGAGTLFRSYDWSLAGSIQRNRRLRQSASSIADEVEEGILNGPPVVILPKTEFSFLSYLADYHWCFRIDKVEDPCVMLYDYGSYETTGFELSEFLLNWTQYE